MTSVPSQTPREIYTNACVRIGRELEPLGFRYLKSGPKLKQASGDLTYELDFGSSTYNSRGYLVLIDVHARVKSKQIKNWRVNQPQCKRKDGKVSDLVAHTDIHYLPKERIRGRWNLDDETERAGVIEEIIEVIMQYALPYFEKFQQPRQVAEELIETLPEVHGPKALGMGPEAFIEYALCFLDADTARQITITYFRKLKKNPKSTWFENFQMAYSHYVSDGVGDDHIPKGIANVVAYYAVKNHWGNIAEGIV